MDCSVVILAAGLSGRMGKTKFALRFNNEKIFLEEIVFQYLSFGCGEVVIVLNIEGYGEFKKFNINFPENVIIAINHYPEKGRMYSLKAGLDILNKRNVTFVHNADNPFVMRDVLKLLFDCILNSDFCVPVYKGRGGHPVLLSENVIRDLFAEDKTDITLRDFLSRYDGKRVDVKSDSVLVNINTPEDYRGYFG